MRLAIRIVFVLDIVFVVSLFSLVTYGLTHLDLFSDKGTKWFYLVQFIGVLGAAGTIVVLINAVLAWMNKRKTIWGKLRATVMLLACLGMLWFCFAGNLLHFTSTY